MGKVGMVTIHRLINMRDNSDVQALHAGQIMDMRIENLLSVIYAQRWEEEHLDTLFTEVIQEFVSPNSPQLFPSVTGHDPLSAQAVFYLHMFGINYSVIHKGTADWPGDFEYLAAATCMVQLCYPINYKVTGGDCHTNWCPGVTLNQAIIAAMVQLAREISADRYSKSEQIQLH